MTENDDAENSAPSASKPTENQPELETGLQPRGESRGDRARMAQAAREADRRDKAAAKLRENLMRRKSQARARRAGDADETQGLPAARNTTAELAAKSDESS